MWARYFKLKKPTFSFVCCSGDSAPTDQINVEVKPTSPHPFQPNLIFPYLSEEERDLLISHSIESKETTVPIWGPNETKYLLADDQLINIKFVASPLGRRKKHAMSSVHPNVAIALYDKYGADVVILDFDMKQELDGVDVAANILLLASLKSRKIPKILFITADAENNPKIEFFKTLHNEHEFIILKKGAFTISELFTLLGLPTTPKRVFLSDNDSVAKKIQTANRLVQSPSPRSN